MEAKAHTNIALHPQSIAFGRFYQALTARKVWAAVVGSHDIIRRSSGLGSRELALKLGGTSAVWANAVWTACSMGGAAVIFLFGLLLFLASLGPARPF